MRIPLSVPRLDPRVWNLFPALALAACGTGPGSSSDGDGTESTQTTDSGEATESADATGPEADLPAEECSAHEDCADAPEMAWSCADGECVPCYFFYEEADDSGGHPVHGCEADEICDAWLCTPLPIIPKCADAPALTAGNMGTGIIESSPAFVDIDEDGNLDFAWRNVQNETWVRFGPDFTSPTMIGMDLPLQWSQDFTGNGNVDLAGFDTFESGVRVFEGDGSLTFTSVFEVDGFFASATLADMDGDGVEDIVVGSSYGYQPSQIVFVDGMGGFWLEDAPALAYGHDVAGWDALPDPAAELVVMLGVEPVLLTDPLSDAQSVPIPTTQTITRSPTIVDLRGDARPELLVTMYDNERPSPVLEEFAIENDIVTRVGFWAATGLEHDFGDIDGDGTVDIVSAQGVLSVHYRSATGDPGGCIARYPELGEGGKVAVADVDDDGKAEIGLSSQGFLRLVQHE